MEGMPWGDSHEGTAMGRSDDNLTQPCLTLALTLPLALTLTLPSTLTPLQLADIVLSTRVTRSAASVLGLGARGSVRVRVGFGVDVGLRGRDRDRDMVKGMGVTG